MTRLHPYDFAVCQIPSQSPEQMLGINISIKRPPSDVFHQRLQFISSSEPSMDLDFEEDPLLNSFDEWNESNFTSILKKTGAMTSSVTIHDITDPSLNLRYISQEIEAEPKMIGTDKPNKITDQWGFVVDDAIGDNATTMNNNRQNSRSLSKLEDKWLDILKDWNSYSEEKRKRICKK